MRRLLALVLLVPLPVVAAQAEPAIGASVRHVASAVFFDRATRTRHGSCRVEYEGQPWAVDAAARATWSSSVPMTVGGVTVPAGEFVVELAANEDATWSVVLRSPGRSVALEAVARELADEPAALGISLAGGRWTATWGARRLDFGAVSPTAAPTSECLARHATRGSATVEFAHGARCAVEYGAPAWRPEYADLEAFVGRRVRLGSDAWATFECSDDVTLGSVDLDAGRYRLVLACASGGGGGEWSLVLLDPVAVDEARIPPWAPARTAGSGRPVPLTLTRADVVCRSLRIGFRRVDGRLRLVLAWGPHRLTSAPIAAAT